MFLVLKHRPGLVGTLFQWNSLDLTINVCKSFFPSFVIFAAAALAKQVWTTWSQQETSLTRCLRRSSHKRSGANRRQFGRPTFRNCPQIRDASLHWRASKRDIGKYRLWVSASLTAMNKTLERSEIIRQRY